ncbi:1,4-alpha-glucan (glycogen) branching enzyme, GH-13-type [hydrothermal vent metagenome]|uniref:1,4-alpha-glucan branching enzyme n=1 Tax=hydrothermal vent metagenome TaxID=652676 RepID=A0A3B0YP78_9ZZZZ
MASKASHTATDALSLPDALQRIIDARHHDPFEVLGRHEDGGQTLVRAFIPWCKNVRLVENGAELKRIKGTDLFEWRGDGSKLPLHYQLAWVGDDGVEHEEYDPYSFPPLIGDLDLHWFGEGRHLHAYRFLGANFRETEGVGGVLFAVWAPNAERISVVGDWNHWDGRRHPLRARGDSGIWELFIPGVHAQSYYKFEIRNRQHGSIHIKSDPYGKAFEMRPGNASVAMGPDEYRWEDQGWMEARRNSDWLHAPMSVYEVHLGSWQRDEQGQFLNYRVLAERLVNWVSELGFTHIELLPVTEHPFDASWGYQTTGYFAPTSRFGNTDDFRWFVDYCHQHNIGVLLDWAPGHFPKDDWALARFDGSPLYEHEDPRRGEHRDWGTLIFNYGRNEVRNFLLSSAIFWLEEMHIDGLRVDAVASMLYLDYSRDPGDWIPNEFGGRENLEAIQFLRHLNEATHSEQPGSVIIAEESTAWPQVTRPVDVGGLGFSMKWNMGWMHDTLQYMSKESVHRQFHHNQLTFGLLYAFNENFVLPFSHDEVVHGKGSMLDKMPGDSWQRFANLRLLYTFMYTYPGKKLLFMGSEFGQYAEWNADASLDWHLMKDERHAGLKQLLGDLNRLYRHEPALHQHDFDAEGFRWIECNDAANSILSYARRCNGHLSITLLNFTPVPRHHFRVGVPEPGDYRLALNSDAGFYVGSDMPVRGSYPSESVPWMNQPQSVVLEVPPLAGLVLIKH